MNWIRHLSKLTCISTLFLIFAGGMVTSTGSGLAVPDWPLSYGTLFPPMIGGIFYEHGHRMVATGVGFLMLMLTIVVAFSPAQRWIKTSCYIALAAVIIQGILGGITVLYYLPTAVSVSHGVLAQSFFLLTIFIAYSLSHERKKRLLELNVPVDKTFINLTFFTLLLIFAQLVIGAIMRHTHSGLAIYDFPTMAGTYWPQLNNEMLAKINLWRFDNDFDSVTMFQVFIHFLHRLMALIIVIVICVLNVVGLKYIKSKTPSGKALLLLDVFIVIQATLGILTVLTLKSDVITSFHVVTGAATLGITFFLLLRALPTSPKLLKSDSEETATVNT